MAAEYKVTLPIFSGRPDPSWSIHSSNECYQKIKEHHERARAAKVAYPRHQLAAKLGFKGFLVHQKDAEHPELIVGQETVAYQQVLLETMPQELIPISLRQKVLQLTSSYVHVPEAAPAEGVGEAPPLDLAKWNSDPDIKANNNAYNYANDQITGTFAQPGRGSGQIYPAITPTDMEAASVRDGLMVPEPRPGPDDPSPTETPTGRWLVALVVATGIDFHWYRLDSNDWWSQKPGGTSATRYDGDNKLILDPRDAANNLIPYQFVTFMTTSKDATIN